MALSTQPYKGTRDFYPEDMRFRRWMFGKLRQTVESYGYQEYDGPMLEPFELYAAKTGEEIVNQQLYWMVDRGERKLAVRPEMTPTLARMVAAKLQELPRPIRLYSIPNLWRYERPQRGRLREHWQLNVDLLGGDALRADAEILNVAHALISRFGAGDRIQIKVNNRKLMDFFFESVLGLKGEAALPVTKAIDARDKIGEEKYVKWLTELGLDSERIGKLDEFFKLSLGEVAKRYACPGSKELVELMALLAASGSRANVVFDPTVMRGLDYYTGTVFEIYDTSPENRRAMFGGGRYDNLIGLFSGGGVKETLSGVGFGMGDVTLQNFLETHGLVPALEGGVDVFVSLPDLAYQTAAHTISHALRAQDLRVIDAVSVDGFGAQLKQASRLGARFAVLFAEDEWKKNQVLVKDLTKQTQQAVDVDQVAAYFKSNVRDQRTTP